MRLRFKSAYRLFQGIQVMPVAVVLAFQHDGGAWRTCIQSTMDVDLFVDEMHGGHLQVTPQISKEGSDVAGEVGAADSLQQLGVAAAKALVDRSIEVPTTGGQQLGGSRGSARGGIHGYLYCVYFTDCISPSTICKAFAIKKS